MIYSGQNVMDHYSKVFGKVVDDVVVRGLWSVHQKLMKVALENLYQVAVLQITKFFFLFTENLNLLCPF